MVEPETRDYEADKMLPWCSQCDMRATGRWQWCTDLGGWGIKCDALRGEFQQPQTGEGG